MMGTPSKDFRQAFPNHFENFKALEEILSFPMFFYFLYLFFCFIYLFICLFAFSRATPATYGGSQAKGLIGAVATGLC